MGARNNPEMRPKWRPATVRLKNWPDSNSGGSAAAAQASNPPEPLPNSVTSEISKGNRESAALGMGRAQTNQRRSRLGDPLINNGRKTLLGQ